MAAVLASIKGFIFYTTTFALALPLFAAMLILAPFVWLFDRHRRLAQHFVNNIWAKVSTTPYYGVQACTLVPPSRLSVGIHLLHSLLLAYLGGMRDSFIASSADRGQGALASRRRAGRVCGQPPELHGEGLLPPANIAPNSATLPTSVLHMLQYLTNACSKPGHLHAVSPGPALQVRVQDLQLLHPHCRLEHVPHRRATGIHPTLALQMHLVSIYRLIS